MGWCDNHHPPTVGDIPRSRAGVRRACNDSKVNGRQEDAQVEIETVHVWHKIQLHLWPLRSSLGEKMSRCASTTKVHNFVYHFFVFVTVVAVGAALEVDGLLVVTTATRSANTYALSFFALGAVLVSVIGVVLALCVLPISTAKSVRVQKACAWACSLCAVLAGYWAVYFAPAVEAGIVLCVGAVVLLAVSSACAATYIILVWGELRACYPFVGMMVGLMFGKIIVNPLLTKPDLWFVAFGTLAFFALSATLVTTFYAEEEIAAQ